MDKTQVIVPRYSRNAYDHALHNVGVEMEMVETPAELIHAINAKTAMIYLVSGESMTGSIFLGEYLTAQFTGRRTIYDHVHQPFVIPGGPPLAT